VDIRPATRIAPAAAAFFAENIGGFLNWDDITELGPATAEALARFDGELCLNGLTRLSAASASVLARHKGALRLNGLAAFSPAVASALARRAGLKLARGGAERRRAKPDRR
jgi:hypothetical protein